MHEGQSYLVSNAFNRYSEGQHRPAVGYGGSPNDPNPAQLLGPGSGPMQVHPYDQVAFTNYAYPTAVERTQLLISDVITGFILEEIEWYTTICLPWMRTDQVTFEWNKWHFDGGLADRVPYEGLSRLITTRRESHRAHIERRGLAFIMEADFADTAVGRQMWDNNVLSIGQSVQETQNHDTIHEILSCKDYSKMWMQRYGREQVAYQSILDDEILTFGSANLHNGEERLGLLTEQWKQLMRRQGEQPDMMILWPGASIYMTMVTDEERMTYWKAGPDGVAKRERGPPALGLFRGLRVFETRDFYVGGPQSPAIQLMTRPVQVAEYYFMGYSHSDDSAYNFSSKNMGTVIYDENADDWRKITFKEAFENTRLFDEHGHLSREVGDLIAHYNEGHVSADGSNGDKEPTFFLAAPDDAGVYGVADYFGKMDVKHMSAQMVERVAESLVGQIQGSTAAEMMGQWGEFKTLISDIQAQPYNEGYWAALIAQNSRISLASDGSFVGQATPENLARYSDSLVQLQWTQNEHGGMDLPEGGSAAGVTIPAGFANVPGLKTLAAKASDGNSQWQQTGIRARRALAMLNTVMEVVRRRLPSSVAVDPAARPRWFHAEDALTTFFSTVVGHVDDPLFLAHLPLTRGAQGGSASAAAAAAAAASGASDDGNLPWFILPGTLYDVQPGSAFTVPGNELIDILQGAATAPSAVAPSGTRVVQNGTVAPANVAVKMPSGGTVTLNAAAFSNVLMLTPELRALGLMPSGKAPDARAARLGFFDAMRKLEDPELRGTLADFVYGFGQSKRTEMWDAMRGLRTLPDAQLEDAIRALHMSPTPTDGERTSSQNQLALLTAAAGDANYGDAEPLTKEWASLFQTGAAPEGSFAFGSIAEDAQRALDLERTLLSTSQAGPALNAARANFVTGNALTPTAAENFAALTAAAGVDATVFAQTKDELAAALGRVTTTLRAQAGDAAAAGGAAAAAAAAAARTMSRGMGGGAPLAVATNPEAVARAAYYRAPLTSSKGLLSSLSSMFAGGVAKPLVLPSDPRTGHTQPYAWTRDDAASVVLPMSTMSMATVGDAMIHAETRSEYRSLQELEADFDHHDVTATPLFMRYRSALESDVVGNGGMSSIVNDEMTAGIGAGAFRDDNAYDISGMSVSGALRTAGMAGKRSRVGAPHHHGGHSHHTGSHGHRDAVQGAYMRLKTSNFMTRWAQASRISNPLVKMAARAFLQSRSDRKDTWDAMIDGNALVPMNILVVRPNIVHDMNSAVIMKGGLTTGANFFGGANVARGSDSQTKRIHYNFTFRSKAQVYKHENVAIIENIAFAGYRGGQNTEWMTHKQDMDRVDRERPSMIAMAIPLGECNQAPHIDLTGLHQIPESDPGRSGPRRWMYSSARYYDHIWGFSARAMANRPLSTQDYFDRADRVTTLASRGAQFLYNSSQGLYNTFVKPQGHLKLHMARPGGKAVMDGAAVRFDPYDYSSVRIS